MKGLAKDCSAQDRQPSQTENYWQFYYAREHRR